MSDFYYTIAFPDGEIDISRAEVLPEAGDILVFVKEFKTPAGDTYEPGDELHLLERTDEAPHGRRSSLGNWSALSKYGCLVWANVEWMLADGIVEAKLQLPDVQSSALDVQC